MILQEKAENDAKHLSKTKNAREAMVYLHQLRQRRALLALRALHASGPSGRTLLIGCFVGALHISPAVFQEHLHRFYLAYNMQQTRNLRRFLKRLLTAYDRLSCII
jgi:hypothetical protein